ncbi:MAG: thymidine phosphorylase [Bacilli bacterium]|nr:thymidine phosphorylase [Bacilli bacterium]
MISIIDKKRNKMQLSKQEFEFAINGYINNTIPDYQMSALLMAICLNGLSDEETFNLTDVMLNSGDKIDLTDIKGLKVDKHSTGGVGDKTTIILAPIVAACGVLMPKMSGRGLGHTGGTIDKLEAIPGFKTNLTLEEFKEQLTKIGCVITGQTGSLVPADKKIYTLRDVTATVSSIPLIATSVMSKKIASGADKIVIDLKVGNGALVKTIKEARKLAELMVKIGQKYDRETICILTNMTEPLGNNIGNALEVLECLELLKGNVKNDLYDLVIYLASHIVSLGKNISIEDANKEVVKVLENGQAYQKFLELVSFQGGNLEKIEVAPKIFSVKSIKSGFINIIDTTKLGEIVKEIGGGRETKEDVIDYGVGIVLSKKLGDYVEKDEELLKIYLNKKDMEIRKILSCFQIDKEKSKQDPLVYELIM